MREVMRTRAVMKVVRKMKVVIWTKVVMKMRVAMRRNEDEKVVEVVIKMRSPVMRIKGRLKKGVEKASGAAPVDHHNELAHLVGFISHPNRPDP
ncbi:hypothetical protein Baya_4059 [Bagarius yarrelli]|uniref:Uncharacterized protein n=1 Tax=Bagarius yarrelli TaxID=175774 RepID=A0A556TXC8_BAGYA|nr:hypothetical protein Baya_4059 [Bagarius yarrelli]